MLQFLKSQGSQILFVRFNCQRIALWSYATSDTILLIGINPAMASAGSLQLSHDLGLCRNQVFKKQFKVQKSYPLFFFWVAFVSWFFYLFFRMLWEEGNHIYLVPPLHPVLRYVFQLQMPESVFFHLNWMVSFKFCSKWLIMVDMGSLF